MTIKPIIEYQGWSEWENKFKPIKNHFRDPQHEEIIFETYGEEMEFLKTQDYRNVWTWVQGDYCDLIVNGFAFVNRIGYYVCEVPWDETKDYEVIISTEVECECYDAETGEGKDDCLVCEGYGMKTEYTE
jgi:hypothetical protein